MISLGIDIGGTSVKLAAVREGKTLWTGQSPSYVRPKAEELVTALTAAAAGRVEPLRRTGELKTGICAPGLFDLERRRVTLSVNVPGLMNVSLDELVARGLGIRPATMEMLSDAVAGCYDVYEVLVLGGRVLGLSIGSGVGAAVLDDGLPLLVEGGSPGHIGQMDVTIVGEEEVIGPDGGMGSLEGYIGVAALRRRYGVEDLVQVIDNMSAKDIPMKALARAIRIAHAIYRPNHVVLYGGLGIRLQHVLPELKRLVDAHLTSVARQNWTLNTGQSDFHAAIGAAKIASKRG